jgi:hypothetical protein
LLLRASGAIAGERLDVTAVTSDAAAAASGIPHAEVLLAFAEAVVGTDDAALAGARAAVLRDLGPEALVDAAAVASNFERMVRVADATGTPLDAPLVMLTETLRRDLDLDRFAAAANTQPPHPVWRMAGRLVPPLVFGLLRLRGRLRGRR